MEGMAKKQWLELCAEAAICDDLARLVELGAEILALLREEQLRLEATPTSSLRR